MEHLTGLEYTSLLITLVILRLWSAWEHKKGQKKVEDIHNKLNGTLDKLLKEKYDKGFADGRKAKGI